MCVFAGKASSGLKEVTDSFSEGIKEAGKDVTESFSEGVREVETGVSTDGGENAVKSASTEDKE